MLEKCGERVYTSQMKGVYSSGRSLISATAPSDGAGLLTHFRVRILPSCEPNAASYIQNRISLLVLLLLGLSSFESYSDLLSTSTPA